MEKAKLMVRAIDEKCADDLSESEQEQLGILIDGGFISVCEDVMKAEFPVFSEDAYNKLTENLLRPAIEKVAAMMIDVSDICEKLLKDYTPARDCDQCGAVAKIHHRLDAGAILLEELITRGDLALPAGKVPLCTFGVKGN